jgi:hypothetical protein
VEAGQIGQVKYSGHLDRLGRLSHLLTGGGPFEAQPSVQIDSPAGVGREAQNPGEIVGLHFCLHVAKLRSRIPALTVELPGIWNGLALFVSEVQASCPVEVGTVGTVENLVSWCCCLENNIPT